MATQPSESHTLKALLARHQRTRVEPLAHNVPLSWWRVAIGVVSYTLLLSDVFRSGLGLRRVALPLVVPDEFLMFGPFAYPVAQVHWNDTTATVSVWPYKFDTTSVSLRAFAEFLDLQVAWPPCLFYKERCASASLDASTVFRMLDALVDAVTMRRDVRGEFVHDITLRVTSNFVDRAHHFILPQVFRSHMARTSHALYFDSATVGPDAFTFCSPDHAQLFACARHITSFAPRGATTSVRERIGRVWYAAVERKRVVQQQFAGLTLDMLVVESQVDYSEPRLAYQGRLFADLVVLTRARQCRNEPSKSSNEPPTPTCKTVAVDDFRVETGMITSNVVQWFPVVATLRVLGQAYAWLRVVMLFIGCYYAHATEPQANIVARLRVAMRLFFLVPSQVVVYGSTFPIGCYVLAHLIDSEAVYSFVSETFGTTLGAFELNVPQFLQLSAVSMRSVWEVALLMHIVVFAATRRAHWSPIDGVPGVHEFTVSVAACSTVIAQLRAIVFRDSRVQSIAAISTGVHTATLRGATYGKPISLGNAIDVKCLVAAAITIALATGAVKCVLAVLYQVGLIRRIDVSVASRTHVSYAADERSGETESMLVLMNLAAMTDPLVLLRLWGLQRGVDIGVYESRTTQRVYLIPQAAVLQSHDTCIDWSDYDLQLVVNTTHLRWRELLQCG